LLAKLLARSLFGLRYEVGDRVEVRVLRGSGAARAAEAVAAAANADSAEAPSSDSAAGTKVLGTLQTLYQIIDGSSRERFSMIDLVPQSAGCEGDAAGDAVADSFLASSLVRKVPESEWARRRKALLDNKPARLEWKECLLPGGTLKGRLPPLAPVVAGSEAMPYRIAIVIVGAEGKPLAKQTAVRRRIS